MGIREGLMEGLGIKNMQSVIITGPTGAIGIALIQQCIKKGVSVFAICRRGSQRICHIPRNPLVKVKEFNLEELSDLNGDSLGIKFPVDAFYHLGWDGTIGSARNDMKIQTENIQYTLDAVMLAKRLGCRVFVGAGSQAEYGRVEGILTPETPARPENGYGMAKLCAGMMSRKLCNDVGIDHIWARILSVYGPYDGDNSMVMTALRKFATGERPQFTGAEQMWDYLYSEDAAKALYLLGEKGLNGNVYCIGSGKVRALREYIEVIRQTVNPQAALGIGELPYAEGQVMHLQADISALRKDTGFEPETDFENGIRKVYEYYREHIEQRGMEG